MLDQHLLEDLGITISSEAYETFDPDLQYSLPIFIEFIRDLVEELKEKKILYDLSCHVDHIYKVVLLHLHYKKFTYSFRYIGCAWDMYSIYPKTEEDLRDKVGRYIIDLRPFREEPREILLERIIEGHMVLTSIAKDNNIY